MKYTKLLITYTDGKDPFVVPFILRDNPVVPKWIERVETAQRQYPIDDPGRFYGFGTIEEQRQDSLDRINHCVHVINDWKPIVERTVESVDDQDTLNYLHHIFEVHHGMLDQQDWQNTPEDVRKALADLNICVHRCESVSRGAYPRHVVTWFGLPKTLRLVKEDFDYFEQTVTSGTVYLNYVEIGKTLADLTRDRDQYIGDDAFKPYDYYSADFNVKFWSTDSRQAEEEYATLREYYAQHQDFFEQRGWHWPNNQLVAEHCPLADIESLKHIKEIEKRRWVQTVTFE
jgi:hypothetical protein